MEAINVAISLDFRSPRLIGVGDMVCDNDGDSRQSSVASSNRGTCAALGSLSWTKKQDTDLYRSNYLISRSITEDASHVMDHGITNGSIALITGLEAKQAQRRAGKVPKNGSGSFGKLKMFQGDDVSTQAENGDAKMESDILGSHFMKCSNTDKYQSVKQRNNINGKRGDRRISRVPMKAKFDPFALKAGFSSFSPSGGGSNAFGMYGLKPDVHDVTKFMEDISLDELLDETYKCPTLDKDKGKKTLNVNNNVLDSVRKVCSLIRPQRTQQDKETEELDIHAINKTPLPSSPSNNSVENGSNDDGTIASLSKCNKDLESCVRDEASTNLSKSTLYQPRDLLERLALPPPKDLDSLLQDAAKPASSTKLTDSRSSKQLSHRVSLPPFPWSHNFNGHYKSNNDTPKTFNKSSCFGRWVRISSTTRFIGGRTEGFVDLESLTYDDSLVPAGLLKYRLPEVGKTSTSFGSQHSCQPGVSCAASLPLPVTAVHSPKVLSAARTLCDMASHSSKHNSGGILKWPKQPSQKAMKARKSRLVEIPEEDFVAPNSEAALNHVVKRVEHGSSSKKPRISPIESRQNYSHVQAVIGLSSVSAPRSNRSSKDSFSEPRHLNGSFVKSSFMVLPHPRVLDRSSSQNPQKLRKITPTDWNRSRS